MEKSSQPPITLDGGAGPSLSVVGDTYRILVTGDQTGGAFATIDMMIPPNGGPPPHSHAGFEESFFIIDGEIEVRSEAGVYTAKKGAFVVIPKGGIVHQFTNKTDRPAHLLCMVVPAGLEKMFMEVGIPVAFDSYLPPPPMDPETGKKMKAIAEKYGQTVYPPDRLANIR